MFRRRPSRPKASRYLINEPPCLARARAPSAPARASRRRGCRRQVVLVESSAHTSSMPACSAAAQTGQSPVQGAARRPSCHLRPRIQICSRLDPPPCSRASPGPGSAACRGGAPWRRRGCRTPWGEHHANADFAIGSSTISICSLSGTSPSISCRQVMPQRSLQRADQRARAQFIAAAVGAHRQRIEQPDLQRHLLEHPAT